MMPTDFFPSRSHIVIIIIFSFLVGCTSCILIWYQPVYALADFNFAAVGDWGCSDDTDSTVSSIVAKNPELVLGLGDYSYYPTGTCWFNKIAPIDNITHISIGNHENDSAEGFRGYMSHFGLSQTYYSFNHQNVHFLVMDTDRNSHLIGSDQYNFVVNDLRAASQDPNIDWIITYFHQIIYTSRSEHIAFTPLRDLYHPIFEKYGVDLVLSGHNHNYQRTFPLRYNSNNSSNPIITSTNANDYHDDDGPIFVIVGTGGIDFQTLLDKEPFVSSQQDKFFGHLDVKITNNGTRLDGKFYRNSGQIDDTFSISKGPAYTPPVANNKNITLTKNTQQVIRLTASDPNNLPLSYTVVTPPTNGSLSGTANNLTYTPNTGHVGFDSFTFKVNNSLLTSNVATMNLTIQNTQPIANSQAIIVNKNNITSVTLTATDSNRDLLNYTIIVPPTNGTLSDTDTAPNLTYHPNTNYVGDDSFTFRANDGTADSNRATVSITVLDPENGTYHYSPGFILTGSNYHDEPSSPSLQLSKFSLAAWFKTSSEYFSPGYIVNKGGVGSENAGQNQNYGLWMSGTGRIRGGFETSTGSDQLVTSVNPYNDGQWHYAVVTHDGSTVRLYVDGLLVGSNETSGSTPESSGTKPVRVGANSRLTPPENFFTGGVDEVRVWKDDLTVQQVSDAFAGKSFNTEEQVLHLPFGTSSAPVPK